MMKNVKVFPRLWEESALVKLVNYLGEENPLRVRRPLVSSPKTPPFLGHGLGFHPKNPSFFKGFEFFMFKGVLPFENPALWGIKILVIFFY